MAKEVEKKPKNVKVKNPLDVGEDEDDYVGFSEGGEKVEGGGRCCIIA